MSEQADSGRVVQLWVKRVRRGPMDAASEAALVAGRGIVGNANQGGRRQVTLLERERWEAATREAGGTLSSAARRANVVIEGLSLAGSRGRVLRVGACRIRIFGETKPCRLMDEVLPGLQAALRPHWNAGAFGEVVDDGVVRVGDGVAWEDGA